MPKKLPTDTNARAFSIVNQALAAANEQPDPEAAMISKVMSAMGRKGGLKGGKARADSMTPEKRSEIAAKAAAARWRETK
jgi:hypothetical protein